MMKVSPLTYRFSIQNSVFDIPSGRVASLVLSNYGPQIIGATTAKEPRGTASGRIIRSLLLAAPCIVEMLLSESQLKGERGCYTILRF
jgi:hypothetical protein